MTQRERVQAFLDKGWVRNGIIGVILFNSVLLGMETSGNLMQRFGPLIIALDRLCLSIFVIEIGLKMYAQRFSFFRSGWNVFDFVIVGIALMPGAGAFAVLRALRILRVLRLVAKVGRLRMIVESLLKAIPSIGWIAFLLGLVFYIFGVMGTKLFGESFPEDFGHLGLTLFSLFQVMTLESWSEEIARPVMEVYPLAWLYFVVFILLSAFTVLNLFIGIIVNTMQERHMEEADAKHQQTEAKAHEERERMLRLIEELHAKVERLENKLDRR